jgi:hypothetical protein
MHQCAPGTERHVALLVQLHCLVIVSNKLFDGSETACLFINGDTHCVYVLPAGPGVNMPPPHDVQEPCLTLEFQCREEGTFKASCARTVRLGGAVRQKPDGFGWGGREEREDPIRQ